MKIQSTDKAHFGQTIKFSKGIKLEFDKDGITEVDDKLGKTLLDNYKGLLFPEGKVPTISKSEMFKKPVPNEELVEKLKSQGRQLDALRDELSRAKDGERAWRLKCDELLKENDKLKKSLEKKNEVKTDVEKTDNEKIKDDEKVNENQNTDTDLRKSLSQKSKDKLVEYAKELTLPEDEWKGLNKEKLIDYIVTKVNTPKESGS